MGQTKLVEYEVWIWEDGGLALHLETQDYNEVISTCKHLSSVGTEYEAYQKVTTLLDI